MYETTVYNQQDHWRRVQYTIAGKYYPATYWEPEERPELVFHSVIGCDEDGNEFEVELDDAEAQHLESQIWEELNSGDDYDE